MLAAGGGQQVMSHPVNYSALICLIVLTSASFASAKCRAVHPYLVCNPGWIQSYCGPRWWTCGPKLVISAHAESNTSSRLPWAFLGPFCPLPAAPGLEELPGVAPTSHEPPSGGRPKGRENQGHMGRGSASRQRTSACLQGGCVR